MEKRPFGKTGLQVSVLGFGGAPVGFLKADADRVGRILNLLLDHGVNVIDTAANYPGSEELIGNTISGRRGQYVLISKCGSANSGIGKPDWSAALIRETVDRSLQRLRTDVLDVMLLHSCDLATLQKGEALGELVKARDAGKVRFIGYSGDNEAAAYAAGLADVAVVQTSVNLADQRNIDQVLPVAKRNNVGVMAKRPIANAAWKETEQQPGMYKQYAQTYHDRFRAMNLNPADLGFSGDPAQAWPEIALRFTLSAPGVHTAIVGTTSEQNTRKNLAFAEKGPLPQDAYEKIRDAFRKADPKGEWKGQT